MVGDQLTCKNVRGSKLWRQTELKVFAMFWGSPAQTGSLCNLREVIRRIHVDKGVKVFIVGDEFLVHAFRAHLTASAMTHLKIIKADEPIDHPITKDWLHDTAERLVTHTLMPNTSTDPLYKMHRSFLHHAFLYIDLREAIRWGNGSQIIRQWKFWLPRFLAAGFSNYSAEEVHLISNLTARFPKHIAYIATHNRTVNISGIPGRAKPIDQLIEHYNL